jgi:hypothetical protein
MRKMVKTMIVKVVEHPKGGYALEYNGGTYQSDNVDTHDIHNATRFIDYIAVSSYLERSYPAYSTWAGKWVSNTEYQISIN